MKLLFVHQHLGEFGGAETNIHLTSGELRRRGHSLSLLYESGTGRDEAAWREIFSDCYGLARPANREKIEAVLDQVQPEVIYLHKMAGLDVLELLLDSGIPIVRMVHDHSLYCMREYKYNYFTRNICTRPVSGFCIFPCLGSLVRSRERSGLPVAWRSYAAKKREVRLNQQCARLIVYSHYLKGELVQNGFDPAKIEVCVPMRVRVNERMTTNFSERNLLLFVGQIIRGKGVDVLLRALARVRTPFQCAIVGDGNHRRSCEKLCAKLGLNGRVQFHGYVPPSQLRNYYLNASVFLMSSLWPEPFGMAGPEAMCYGVPVVGFDAGGIREWLIDGHNGYLVPWNDTAAFTARIDELLVNKDRARQLGNRAKDWVKRYDAPKQIDILENAFRRAARQEQTLLPNSMPAPVSLCL